MLMASRMAVPPRVSILSNTCSSFLMLFVNGASRYATSLKSTIKTSSCGFEALISSSAAAATFGRFSRMLPLLSMIMPIDTGTSSRLKIFSGCSTLFSNTLNADWGRVVTSLLFLSSTLACRTTSFVSSVNVGVSSCGGGGVWAAARAVRTAAKNRLLRRCIISSSERRLQRRQSHRLYQLNLHPPVFSILHQILWRITQNILIPQLQSDLGRHVRQLGQIVHREILAAGLLGQLPQHARTAHLLRRPAARSHGLVNPDGIDLYIGFAHGVANLGRGVTAGIVSAVGKNEDRLARIARLLHMLHGHVDAVEQRGPALGLRKGQAILNLFGIGRQADHQLRAVVKTNQEKLVFRIRRFEELRHGLARFHQLAAHAAAGIENDAHRQRRVLA